MCNHIIWSVMMEFTKGLYQMGMVTCEICNEDIGSVVYS